MTGSHEVRGSIPLGSTKTLPPFIMQRKCYYITGADSLWKNFPRLPSLFTFA